MVPERSTIVTFTQSRIWLWIALILVSIAWLATLQTDIGASNDRFPDTTGLVGPLMDDSGEFVIAWHTWGVTHAPGYPLLNLLGNLATRLFGLFPVTPVTAASLVSFVAGLAALVLLARIVGPNNPMAAAAAVLVAAFGGMIWLYSAVAEVYAFALLLAMGLLVLGLALGQKPEPWKALLFGLLFGLAIGHHRTLLALLPALAVAVWPARRLGWRVWLGAGLLAVLSLSIYVYLPLAAWRGSPWIYGRAPTTWSGFIDAVLAREYQTQLTPPTTLPAIIEALIGRIYFLRLEMTTPGFIVGLIGLGVALLNTLTRRPAIVLSLVFAGYLFAPIGQYLLIGTHLLIMVAAFALAGGWALGLLALSQRSLLALWAGLGISLLVAANAWQAHDQWVLSYTRDPLGRQIINATAKVAAEVPQPVVIETWGPRYFSLAYGKYVTRELDSITLMDARDRLRGLSPADQMPETFYTTRDMLYLIGLDQWEAYLGGAPISLESAGDGLVAIHQTPRLEPAPSRPDNDEIILRRQRAWLDDNQDVRVELQWQALTHPATDYHIFVHVTDQDQITRPEDIIAQGDRLHPVYGFYPTSRWRPGEIVRDDFRIPTPAGRLAQKVFVGLYTVAPDGQFVNHLIQEIKIE